MRAAPGMHVEWVDDEAVVLNPDTGEFHYLNPPAALVYALILEHGYERGLEELERLHGDRPESNQDLRNVLDDMLDKGFLIDD